MTIVPNKVFNFKDASYTVSIRIDDPILICSVSPESAEVLAACRLSYIVLGTVDEEFVATSVFG